MSPTLVRPRSRLELTEQFGPIITQEGILYMDSNTTLRVCLDRTYFAEIENLLLKSL